ncbi:hypothetical protein WJX79_010075 [Trebouxia sp. C0005]
MWTLHTKGCQAAKEVCTEKNSPWTGGWIEIPVVPNVEAVTGTRFYNIKPQGPSVKSSVKAKYIRLSISRLVTAHTLACFRRCL